MGRCELRGAVVGDLRRVLEGVECHLVNLAHVAVITSFKLTLINLI